jgi:16S rRNA (adenine1518-N6/adenine1519-N6)-dimethyltransferase
VVRKVTPGKESLLGQTRGLLRRFNLSARKGLGQHFLIDREVLSLIISAADLNSDDTVIEIGPGLGVLTREIAARVGQVVSVELDDNLADILRQTLSSVDNVTIVNEDILKVKPVTLLKGTGTNYKMVANLPYYITSPVLRHFLEDSIKPKLMVVMVQKEVAETIIAAPGDMSLLSISVQLYGEPTIVSYVPAECFYPAPQVDSAILKVNVYPEPAIEISNEVDFFELVRAGFATPRKQITNSLAYGLGVSKTDVMPLLEMAGITGQRRAETLTLDEWAKLWQAYTRLKEDK